VFLLPLGDLFKVEATYNWKDKNLTLKKEAELIDRIKVCFVTLYHGAFWGVDQQ
jgi:hypothetical protein